MGVTGAFLAASRAALSFAKSAPATKLMRWSASGASALMWKPIQDHVQLRVQNALESRLRSVQPQPGASMPSGQAGQPEAATSLRLEPPICFHHIPSNRQCSGLIAISDISQNRLSFVVRFNDGAVILCPADSLRMEVSAPDRDT